MRVEVDVVGTAIGMIQGIGIISAAGIRVVAFAVVRGAAAVGRGPAVAAPAAAPLTGRSPTARAVEAAAFGNRAVEREALVARQAPCILSAARVGGMVFKRAGGAAAAGGLRPRAARERVLAFVAVGVAAAAAFVGHPLCHY